MDSILPTRDDYGVLEKRLTYAALTWMVVLGTLAFVLFPIDDTAAAALILTGAIPLLILNR